MALTAVKVDKAAAVAKRREVGLKSMFVVCLGCLEKGWGIFLKTRAVMEERVTLTW